MLAEDFLKDVQSRTSVEQVSRLLAAQAGKLGFPVHVIAPVPTPESPIGEGGFLVQNWPPVWDALYYERGFAEFDPIPRAAVILSRPITVADIMNGGAGFVPDPRAAELLQAATALGCPQGVLIPIFGPHGYRAIVCYAGTSPAPGAVAMAWLHVWAIYAHDQIRALLPNPKMADSPISEREASVLRSLRNGLSDREIAIHLGISIRTVRFHASNIRRKLGVSTRIEAVAFATKTGLLDP